MVFKMSSFHILCVYIVQVHVVYSFPFFIFILEDHLLDK